MLATVATGVVAPACGDNAPATQPSGPGLVIDERAGKVDGVGLGDSPREIRRALGASTGNSAQQPTSKVGLPWVIEPPRGRPRGERPVVVAYSDMNFLAMPRSGAYTMSIWRDGARTDDGVQLGDPLSRARERYPRLKCGVRNKDTEYVPYSFCRGRAGRNWIWFGRDPIMSITVSSTPIG